MRIQSAGAPDITYQVADGVDPYGSTRPQSGLLDVRALLNQVWRAKIFVLAVTLAGTGAASVAVAQLTPLYRAAALVRIEPDRSKIVDFDNVADGILSADRQTLETEVAVIGSREHARLAVRQLGLVSQIMETRLAGDESNGDVFPGILDGILDALPFTRARADEDLEPLDPGAVEDWLVEDYRAHLNVTIEPNTRIVRISFESPDPEFAAISANTTAHIYIEAQQQQQSDTTAQAGQWLELRAREAEARFLSAKRALSELKTASSSTGIGDPVLPIQQLEEMSTELGRNRADLVRATARLAQAQRLYTADPAEFAASAAVLDATQIQLLRAKEASLEGRLSELRSVYRSGHPALINAATELRGLQSEFALEVSKVVEGLAQEAVVLESEVRGLEEETLALQQNVNALNEAAAESSALEAEVATSRSLFETLLRRLKETGLQDDTLLGTDARIIDRAVVPGGAFFPRQNAILALTFVVSLMLGLLIALSRDFLMPGFRSLSELRAETGLSSLALVPNVRRRRFWEVLPFLARKPDMVYDEAIRTLRTNLVLSASEAPPQILMLCSSVPGEGKTSLVVSLAEQVAETGKRVVIVDCDLRNPNVANYLDRGQRDVGLCEYLEGRMEVGDIIRPGPDAGLFYIPAGGLASQPPDLLSSVRMADLLEALRRDFDLVLIDSPPLLAVADALLLAREVDALAYLVQWGKTERATVLAGLQMMIEAKAPIAGVVLSRVDINRRSHYTNAQSDLCFVRSIRGYGVAH